MALGIVGCAMMTPIVLALARLPAFAGYYAPQATAPVDVVLTTALEVIPAEFFYRGFLLFALLRVSGPIAVVIATLPFAFAHLGKPEVETLSTLGGGLLYGWLDWRTGSVPVERPRAHLDPVARGRRRGCCGGVGGRLSDAGRPAGRILGSMARDVAPPEIIALAESRAAARRARDWTRADALRAEIEAAGWRVVDSGTMYDLGRLAPPDLVEGDLVRYGCSSSIPARFDEAPVGVASVVLVATDWPDDLARTLRALAAHAPAGTQVVVVANHPSEEQAAALAALASPDSAHDAPLAMDVEIVWTSTRLGWAGGGPQRRHPARGRAGGDPHGHSVEPVGDLVTELATALFEDATVAVTGPFGLVSTDMRRFGDAPDGSGDVDAIEGYALAFRRADYVRCGPLDEHFVFYRNLDVLWLVLREARPQTGRRARTGMRHPGAPCGRPTRP